MSLSVTVESDRDLVELSGRIQSEIIEAMRDATDDAGADPKAPCRVVIDPEVEVVAEPPEGDTEEARA